MAAGCGAAGGCSRPGSPPAPPPFWVLSSVDGVTSDWLCLGWEGALDPAINVVASLCADVRFFGLAQRMGALAAGFQFLLGADWSGTLVCAGFAGPWRLVLSHMALSHMRWGRGRCAHVMGAYSAACPQRLM
jgi:hypothetical protein